jgi:hypothetical protein
MRFHHPGALVAATLVLSTVPGHAGTCSLEIERMQARVDAMIAATAAAGPTAPQSGAATMHRQPTPGSIVAAEEKLGEGARAERALAAMARARGADKAGDNGACERALADVQGVIGP